MKYFVLLLTLLNIQVYSFAQDAKADVILNAYVQKMKSYNSYYYEFKTLVNSTQSNFQKAIGGKKWQKGQKFHFVLGDDIFIYNEIDTYHILKRKETILVKNGLSNQAFERSADFFIHSITQMKTRYEKLEILDNEAVHVITVSPLKTYLHDYQKAVIYISKESNELRKTVIMTKDKMVYTTTIKNLTPNVDVPASKFTFNKSNYPDYQILRK